MSWALSRSEAPIIALLSCLAARDAQRIFHKRPLTRAPEFQVKDSHLPIPDDPGLGIDLVQDRVQSFLWAECALR